MTADAAVPLVYNPAAGAGKGEARLQVALRELERVRVAVRPVRTQRPRHATQLVRELAAEHGRILVLGGDGTQSEAAEGALGLTAARRPELGFLPAGTGNDFLRDFGVTRLRQAVQAIATGQARPVDAMRVRWQGGEPGERHLINVFGTGIMAQAGDRAGRDWKWMGRRGYDVAALLEIMAMQPTATSLVLDGKPADGDYPLVAVCNSSCTGGGMAIAPDARPDDGWLDVVTVQDAGRAELLKLLALHLRKGTHVKDPKVQVRRARRVEVRPEQVSPLLLDGEIDGRTPATAELLPGALRVLLPP